LMTIVRLCQTEGEAEDPSSAFCSLSSTILSYSAAENRYFD
jgi:hypothetical protein